MGCTGSKEKTMVKDSIERIFLGPDYVLEAKVDQDVEQAL